MGLAGQDLRAEAVRSVACGASETFARRRLYLRGEGGGDRVGGAELGSLWRRFSPHSAPAPSPFFQVGDPLLSGASQSPRGGTAAPEPEGTGPAEHPRGRRSGRSQEELAVHPIRMCAPPTSAALCSAVRESANGVDAALFLGCRVYSGGKRSEKTKNEVNKLTVVKIVL